MKPVPEMAFQVENIGKAYRIYPSPAYRLKEILLKKPQHRLFHALKDVSFSIPRGEGFGIVGENGAGKSTLLKILANTLKPTGGAVRRNGRIAALLELGAGFNPELSGEENIFLNAYLLGLKKREIEAKREEIIDFSEIGEFIDQPVKNYSSGMVVRLAFSIAASVDPDILIVDEALSVGDMHFQRKCIDRMMAFRKQGKTMVFCSHSMYMVKQLCTQGVWLKHGAIMAAGPVDEVTEAYNDYMREKDKVGDDDYLAEVLSGDREDGVPFAKEEKTRDEHGEDGTQVRQDGFPVVEEVLTKNEQGEVCTRFRSGDTLHVEIKGLTQGFEGDVTVGMSIQGPANLFCYAVSTEIDRVRFAVAGERFSIGIAFPKLPLLSGVYHVGAYLLDNHGVQPFFLRDGLASFQVRHDSREAGLVRLEHRWIV